MLDLKLLPHAGGVLELAWRGRLGDYPRALVWSPFGDRLVVGDAAGTLTCFEAETGALVWSTPAHEDAILALAVHPREAILASAGQDGSGRLWELDGAASPRILTGDAAWVEHLAWSASGDWLASASGRHLRIWTPEGELVARTSAHASAVSGIHWCGDEEIASACYGRVSFWNPANGDLRERLDWKGSLISLAVSSDGAIVACGSQDRTVHFWRRRSGEDSMMSGYPYKPAAIDFDWSARLLATPGPNTQPSGASAAPGRKEAPRKSWRAIPSPSRICVSPMRDAGLRRVRRTVWFSSGISTQRAGAAWSAGRLQQRLWSGSPGAATTRRWRRSIPPAASPSGTVPEMRRRHGGAKIHPDGRPGRRSGSQGRRGFLGRQRSPPAGQGDSFYVDGARSSSQTWLRTTL